MAKNDASPKNAAAPVNGAIDTSTWENEKVGFDPYFIIAEKSSFVAQYMGKDETGDFVRHQFMASQPMLCQRGPNKVKTERTETVDINAGDTFNISEFYSLGKLLAEYLNYSEDTGKSVTVCVECTGSVVTQSGNDCWLWAVKVPPTVKAALREWRKEHSPKALKAATEARAQLAQ